jgi:hypothetical protein
MTVVGDFSVRGGIKTVVRAEYAAHTGMADGVRLKGGQP